MKGWVYQLSKAELATEPDHLGIENEGNLDCLRRRLIRYIDINSQYGTIPEHPQAMEPKEDTQPTPTDTAKIMNQIRKWGCHFDGKDPFAFLERIKELRQGYGYSGEQLLLGLPELLRDDTLLWYRNNRAAWSSWEEFNQAFRRHFLPRRYRGQLTREIQKRYQQPGETFDKYATALLTKMRRAGGFTTEAQIEQLYDNMNPEYKLYIRLDDITDLEELSSRAAEFEAIEKQRRERTSERAPTTGPSVAAAAYKREECCWRCKQRGHTRLDCKRPPKKFCSHCGKDGVLTRDCHPPGNADRAGEEAARPPQPST